LETAMLDEIEQILEEDFGIQGIVKPRSDLAAITNTVTRDYFILACICRSLDGDFYKILHKLELVICKVQSKGKHILVCGEWNINFLQRSVKLSELQNLLFLYNLANMLKSPTIIMHNTSLLIDVMITNNLILKSKL
jgi:hypothetical protein